MTDLVTSPAIVKVIRGESRYWWSKFRRMGLTVEDLEQEAYVLAIVISSSTRVSVAELPRYLRTSIRNHYRNMLKAANRQQRQAPDPGWKEDFRRYYQASMSPAPPDVVAALRRALSQDLTPAAHLRLLRRGLL